MEKELSTGKHIEELLELLIGGEKLHPVQSLALEGALSEETASRVDGVSIRFQFADKTHSSQISERA